MEIKKIKENSAKILILILNLILAMGGVLYFKNKDREKKEGQVEQEQVSNEEAAKYEIDKIQEALIEAKIKNEESIANNPDTVTKQETTVIQKTYPAVTKKVTVPKPSKSTSTS